MEEKSPRKNRAPLFLIGSVVLCVILFLLSPLLPEFPFLRLAYQVFLICGLGWAIYTYAGEKVYCYRVGVAGFELFLSQRKFSGEDPVPLLRIPSDAILAVVPCSDLGCVPRRFRYGVTDRRKAQLLTYREDETEKALLFQPSDEFVKILQQIVLDNKEKM